MKKPTTSVKLRRGLTNSALHVLLAVLSVLWILPIVYLLYTSLRVQPDTGIVFQLIPDNLVLGFDNYVRLFTETKFLKWMGNTLLVAACSCVLSTLFVLMVAYAMSRIRFKMRKPLSKFMLILGMFPGFMSMTAIYFILKAINLTGTLFALILVYSAGAGMSYYISKGFFDTVPIQLDEAAKLDGATQAQIFAKVVLPLSKPIIVYTVLTTFIAPWCDFIFVNVVMNATDEDKFTVALGLFRMINAEHNSFNANFTTFCAGAVIVAIPITLLFFFMQRYYVEGVTGGAVKG